MSMLFAKITLDNALIRLQTVQAMKRPTKRSQINIYNLITNTDNLVESELEWIQHTPDLVAPGCGDEYGWLNSAFEDALSAISKVITLVSDTLCFPFPAPVSVGTYIPDVLDVGSPKTCTLDVRETFQISRLIHEDRPFSEPASRKSRPALRTCGCCPLHDSTSSLAWSLQ